MAGVQGAPHQEARDGKGRARTLISHVSFCTSLQPRCRHPHQVPSLMPDHAEQEMTFMKSHPPSLFHTLLPGGLTPSVQL
jgi:hypothetical protein